MKTRNTLILAVLAVVLAGAALWLSDSRRAAEQSSVQQAAVPGLKERLATIEKVILTGAGNKAIATVQRSDAGWHLVERNYPADTAALRSLLLGLADARRVEAKTASEKLYERLGVEDVAAEGAQGVKLELLGGGEPLAVIVGQNNANGKGTYLRMANEAQSWLIDRNVAVEKSAANWLQRELLDIAPERVAQLVIEADKERIEIAADDTAAGDFKLLNLPKGREVASEFVADGSAGLLQDLRFDDVADAAAQLPQPPLRKARFELKDGLRIELVSWQNEDKTWAQFSAQLDEAAAVAAIDAEQAKAKAEWEAKQAAADAAPEPEATPTDAATVPSEAKPATDEPELAPEAPLAVRDPQADREQRLAALREQQATLSARFDKRVFVLPSFKAGNLNRGLEAYLKPKS